MTKRPSRQSQRFIEFARDVGADESPEAFEQMFAKVVPPKTVAPSPDTKKPGRKGPGSGA